MKKSHIGIVIVVFLFLFGSCCMDLDDSTPNPNTGNMSVPEISWPSEGETIDNEHNGGDLGQTEQENTQQAVDALSNAEYREIVRQEIIAMLNKHNLYVSHIDSSYPCVHFFVEPGVMTDDGSVVASGLTLEEYEELYKCIKEELHTILDRYQLAKPKTVFHACDSIVGIFFYNWFVDEQKVYDRVDSLQVASYQLDLLEYYHDYEEDAYLRMEGFSAKPWSKYAVYTP